MLLCHIFFCHFHRFFLQDTRFSNKIWIAMAQNRDKHTFGATGSAINMYSNRNRMETTRVIIYQDPLKFQRNFTLEFDNHRVLNMKSLKDCLKACGMYGKHIYVWVGSLYHSLSVNEMNSQTFNRQTDRLMDIVNTPIWVAFIILPYVKTPNCCKWLTFAIPLKNYFHKLTCSIKSWTIYPGHFVLKFRGFLKSFRLRFWVFQQRCHVYHVVNVRVDLYRQPVAFCVTKFL